MDDQISIIKTARPIAVKSKSTNTLLGRGLAAIQNQKTDLIIADLDAQYRQARDVFNRITGCSWYGGNSFFWFGDDNHWTNEKIKELRSCFTTFRSLAAQGYGKVYFPLSIIFKDILGMPEDDIPEDKQQAIKYAQLAFDWCFDNQLQDDPEIWSDLGMLYRWGEVVEIDNALAFFWFKKSAEKDNAQAQFCLGLMYQYGKGVEKDPEKAIYWYREAEKKGYVNASCCLGFMARIEAAEKSPTESSYALGYMYEKGQGIEQDDEEAVYWYQKSADQGNTFAMKKLKELGIK